MGIGERRRAASGIDHYKPFSVFFFQNPLFMPDFELETAEHEEPVETTELCSSPGGQYWSGKRLGSRPFILVPM